MRATVYERGQMVIPSRARKAANIRPGDVLSVSLEGDGRIVLIRLERPKAVALKVKITRRKGTHSVATCGRPITTEQVRDWMADFP